MTEIYHISPVEEAEQEKVSYWEQKLEDAERAVSYAKRMLAQLAIEKSANE